MTKDTQQGTIIINRSGGSTCPGGSLSEQAEPSLTEKARAHTRFQRNDGLQVICRKNKDASKRPWFLGGAKRGSQRCDPFVHIGWSDDHVRGVLGALVGRPTGRRSEIVTAGQIPRENGHDAYFVLTAGALLPVLLALYDVPEAWIWRGSGVLFALPMLSLQVTYPRRRRKVVGTGPPPAIFSVFVVFGSAVTFAMLGYVLAGLQYLAAAYITALTIDFFTVVFAFVIALDVIMQQPMEVSERPASP
ncbi:MAG: hypothetical protein WBE92_12455 [Steroidobacteraceae bacterium]